MRGDRRLLLVLLAGSVLWTAALAALLGSEHNGLIDLRVYRTGAQAWLQGVPLYDKAFPEPLSGPHLPFTYPPLAAVLFTGLYVLPWWIAVAVVIGTGILGLAVACRLAAARLSVPATPSDGLKGAFSPPSGLKGAFSPLRHHPRAALLAGAAVAAAPLIEPVRETVSFGQINLLLVGMIAADCLLKRTPWPRGMLIGIAAAVKLTPAAFVLFFVARRQWRPVVVAAATFGAGALLGLLLAPRDTRAYWFGALLDPARIGGLEFTSNQSLRGLLHRLQPPAALETVAWLGLSAVVGVLALVGVAALRRRGDDVGALLVTAAAALLVSPVSWSHHWVWAVLGMLWLVHHAEPSDGAQDRTARKPPMLTLAAGTLVLFAAAPFWWLPYRDQRELDWSFGQHLLGNAYVWVALAVVMAGAVAAVRARRTPTTSPEEPFAPASA